MFGFSGTSLNHKQIANWWVCASWFFGRGPPHLGDAGEDGVSANNTQAEYTVSSCECLSSCF